MYILKILEKIRNSDELPRFDAFLQSDESDQKIISIEHRSLLHFPDSYKEFLLKYGGGDIEGEETNIIILSTDELIKDEMTKIDGVKSAFVFGTDNGGSYYFFDVLNELGHGEYAVFDVYPGNAKKEFCTYLAKNFDDLIERIICNSPFG